MATVTVVAGEGGLHGKREGDGGALGDVSLCVRTLDKKEWFLQVCLHFPDFLHAA